MKRTLLSLLALSLLSCFRLYATETEPNDTRNTSNKLNLNNSNTGAINVANDVDWWRVTTNADGKLSLTLAISNGLNCYWQLYDFDGTTLLGSSFTSGTSTYSKDGLAQGTYYIKIFAYFAGQLPAYTISNSLTEAAVANDTEPNDDYTQSGVLTQDGSVTGHIGYYYNLLSDGVDWWTLSTNGDGKISLTMAVSNGQNVYWQLYDHDGITQLGSTYTSGTSTLNVDGLAAGIYFVKVFPYFSDGFAPYTLSNTLTPAAVANDTEPNDVYTQSGVLPLNGSVTGHIGYYYDMLRDGEDWYSLTTDGDGKINLTLSSSNGQNVYMALYDNDGVTGLGAWYTAGTTTQSVDGLAAGKYYVRVYPYYSNGFAPYTLSNTLTPAAVDNDVEPNDIKAQAKNISLNSTKSGHIGYYYNGLRDGVDWFKFTTNTDGRVKLMLKSYNGQNVYWQLFDKDGTTSIYNAYTAGTSSYVVDGLAEGTYYIKIYPYYSTGFAPYEITDSLFAAPVANDAEPNNSKSKAQDFALGSSVTGHIGYYYNNERDSTDFYKLITTSDGAINLTLTSLNGKNVYYQLYDNDAVTLLKSAYTASTSSTLTDGLAAGVYYVKIFCYYVNEFAPYTLSNSLSQYAYTDDGLDNDIPKKAATLPVDIGNNGHVGFRYNGGAQDLTDWWKINFMGKSDMTVTLTWNPEFCCGSKNVFLRIYKDTALAPIYNQYSSSGTLVANLTGLAKQYYYVQVVMYYSNEFAAYNLVPAFKQKQKAKIDLLSSVVGTDCSNASIEYKCKKSSKPYTVQLFRNGKKYNDPIIINSKSAFTIGSLPPGNYYATVYGDGATGQGKGTSVSVTLVPTPTNLYAANITNQKAKLFWDTLSCITYDSIYYRKLGTTPWTKIATGTNKLGYNLTGLSAATTYQWKVANVLDTLGETATSAYSAISTFTTNPLKVGDEAISESGNLSLYPNPAVSNTTLSFYQDGASSAQLSIFDALGRNIQLQTLASDQGVFTHTINLSGYSPGVYLLRVTMDGKEETIKLIKQ